MKNGMLTIILGTAILFALGLLMVFNTTSAEVLDLDLKVSTHHALLRQLVALAIGLAVGALIYSFGYRRVLRLSPYLFGLLVGLLLLVLIPGVGQRINGARRWIGIASFSFQPSELLKIVLPLYFVYLLTQRERLPLLTFYKQMLPFAAAIFLVLIEPDNGAAFMLTLTLMALFLVCRIRIYCWGVPVLVLGLVAGLFLLQMPHVQRRLGAYLHPELDLQGRGHQPYQARIAVGSGRLTGRGLGKSRQKLSYLPEARCDYIMAIFAEELGFIGVLFLILLYLILISSGFYIAASASSLEGFYLSTILTFSLALQTFINLGVVSGLLPSKGTNLPFFSQGGSSLLVNIGLVALLLSVAQHSDVDRRCRL